MCNIRISASCCLTEADLHPFGTACARREADDVIVCQTGAEYSWGSILTYEAFGQSYPYDGEFGIGISQEAAVCAITMRNEIKCAGPYFPPDLLAQLEAVNDRNRIPLIDVED